MGLDLIYMVQDMDQWWAVVDMLMNVWVYAVC
jgi:hypothetical protein